MSASPHRRALEDENRRLRERLRELGGAPDGAADFTVELLGPPRVRRRTPRGELVEVPWRLRRSRRLLALLALAPGRRVTREQIVRLLWPDSDAARVGRNLHPTLYSLRRALGEARRGVPALLGGGGAYALNPELEWRIDVREFEAALATGAELSARGDEGAAEQRWRHALALYRGPFLIGDDDPWVEEQRESLRQRRQTLLRSLGALYERRGDFDSALDAYRLSLAEEALQEDLHLALLRVYARQGRRDLVRRHFDRFSRMLSEELGVEPGLQTTLEYHRLMAASEG